ncbi:MAG: bifunctional metallophosphatase/5'-nucleotidase [Bacteroidales bacterium]|nr:bifunctional metallophosphatase/5'-nucleotidase [Bacteroidales bacterium]
MHLKSLIVILISGILFFNSCNQVERPEKLTIKIIQTSDVHGAVFPYDFLEDKPSNNSLAQVHTFVKQEKAKVDQEVIFLDNGDILQGDPAVYFYNFVKTDGNHLLSEVMNFMNYDAATIGNHDIEPGHPVYDKIREAFNFPWLAANAREVSSGKPYFKPYTIIEKQGVKIAVLGLITPAIPQWLPESIWEGITFEDMIESAKYWTEEIRRNEKPDLLIGLFHAGNDFSYNNQNAETRNNENASKLVAEQIPGFDVVFVGHDHHGWNEKVSNWAGNEVQILGPTSRARNVAVAKIELTLNHHTNHYEKNISGELVNMEDFAPDPEFIDKFSNHFDEIKAYVSRPLGTIASSISSSDAFFGDAQFTDLIHRAQMDLTGAEISFTAPLSFNKEIAEGEIYVRDLFKIYRYENLMYTMKLGGKEILDYLEYSCGLWFGQMDDVDDHLINFKEDNQGKVIVDNGSAKLRNAYYNFDNAEGILYTVDVSKPVGSRITIISMTDGSLFDLNKTYNVAVNSYRGNGGGGHLTAGAKIRPELLSDRIISNSEKDFRFYLMEWIEKQDNVESSVNNNWKIIPESWAKSAIPRDRKLLFGEE